MSHWYEEAVFYHIYPLGFTGAPFNNHGEEGRGFDLLDRFLPHVKEMGFTAMYIGPLFESSTHGYDTKDYRTVDKRLGRNEDFKAFADHCHDMGIRVVVDGVFNHTGREFFAFEDIRKNRENSPYRDWYKGINFGGNTHYNDGFGYEAWRGFYELANLNLKNPQVKEYLLDTIRFWIQEFDIDGIRLDCADCLDFDFMREMRSLCDSVKPEFWLMGEVIHGDYSRWVGEGLLHSVTNYELHKGLYSGHNDQNYFEIAHTVRRLSDENGGLCRGKWLYSFTDNHDVDRLMSKLKNKEDFYPVQTLLYALPGIPSIYYGSEWGIEGKKENGRDEPLRPAVDPEDEESRKNEYAAYIRQLGRIYSENKELALGRYKELLLTNRQFAFVRFLEGSAVITAVNNDDKEAAVVLPAFENFQKAMDLFTGEELPLKENGGIELLLKPHRGAMLKLAKE